MVPAYGKPDNLEALPGVAAPYDMVFIDAGAKLESMITAAVKVADAVLIPVQPRPSDLWAASDPVDLIKAREEVTEGKPPAAFILCRAVRNTRLAGEISAAVAEDDRPVFASLIVPRQSSPRTAAEGLTVFSSLNKGGENEIIAIADEIQSRFTSEKGRHVAWRQKTQQAPSTPVAGSHGYGRGEKAPECQVEASLYRRIKTQSAREDRSISDITRQLWMEDLSKHIIE